MKQFLITVAGVLVGMIIFLVLGPILLIGAITASISQAPPQPAHMVLSLDLREPMTDQRPASPFAAFSAGPSLLDMVTRIEAAANDRRVEGIFIRASTDGMAPAEAEEVRAALQSFRAAGKFVVAHLQGEGARMSMPGYMAIADADEVWLQESSEFLPMGLSAEVTFFADTLRRYRLQAQFETRNEHKTAANELTQRGFTAAHREQITGLLGGLYDIMIANIAADREIDPQAARAAVEATPFSAQRAVELHLVDRLGWPEAAERAALARVENTEIVEFAAYRPNSHRGGAVIAVVQGEGIIATGPEENDLFADESVMTSDRIAEALIDAAEDDDVRAIVFRVSSPGGSAVASDQMLAALRIARESEKPIVVSMGSVAASGGYYVATHANEIVASPSTITGSIGVVSGKLVIGGALEHYLSAHTDNISIGSPFVNMFTSERPFTPAEAAMHAQGVDRTYDTFVNLVSDGRGIPAEQVRAMAGGRVWTGQQALERRLVDHLGGFSLAVARARALAGIAEDERVPLHSFPSEESPFQAIERLFGVSSEGAQALARMNTIMSDPRFVRALAAVREEEAGVRAQTEHIELR